MTKKSEVATNDFATGRVPTNQKKSDWDVAVVTAGFWGGILMHTDLAKLAKACGK